MYIVLIYIVSHVYSIDIYIVSHLRVIKRVNNRMNVVDAARAKPAKGPKRTRSPAPNITIIT